MFFLYAFRVVTSSSQPLPVEFRQRATLQHPSLFKPNCTRIRKPSDGGKAFGCPTWRNRLCRVRLGASEAVRQTYYFSGRYPHASTPPDRDKPPLSCPPPGAAGCAVAPLRSRAEWSSLTQRLRFRPAKGGAQQGDRGSGGSGEGSFDETDGLAFRQARLNVYGAK